VNPSQGRVRETCDALSIVISPEPFGDLGSVEPCFGSQRCEDIMVAHILAFENIPFEESFDDGASRLPLLGHHLLCDGGMVRLDL